MGIAILGDVDFMWADVVVKMTKAGRTYERREGVSELGYEKLREIGKKWEWRN